MHTNCIQQLTLRVYKLLTLRVFQQPIIFQHVRKHITVQLFHSDRFNVVFTYIYGFDIRSNLNCMCFVFLLMDTLRRIPRATPCFTAVQLTV